MFSTRWFLLPDDRLRAGWRLLLFGALCTVSLFLFQWTASAFSRDLNSPVAVLAASSAAFLAAVCTATWLAMSLLEHQPFSAVGLTLRKRAMLQAAEGFAIGAGLVGAITGVEWLLGAIHFQSSGAGAMPALALIGSGAGIFVLSAASEELLFRGYAYQRLIEGTNDYVAVAVSAIFFGAVHQWNPHVTSLALANTILAGVLLAVAYLKTRALWLPIGFHFSWNWTLALFGLPISGVDLGKMPWEAVSSSSHVWLYGGEYGPEGGIVASAVLVVGIVCMLAYGGHVSPTPRDQKGDPIAGDDSPTIAGDPSR